MQPSEEKVAVTRNVEPPQSASEVRSFLGLVQYSSKFLPDFTEVAEPLRKLTRTVQRFVWGTAQRDSFLKLKELISRAATLAYFQQDSMKRIVADAGPSGLGAVMVQLQGDSWRVFFFFKVHIWHNKWINMILSKKSFKIYDWKGFYETILKQFTPRRLTNFLIFYSIFSFSMVFSILKQPIVCTF